MIYTKEFHTKLKSEIVDREEYSQVAVAIGIIAALLDEIERLQARWIPVSERLPDYGVIVLVVYAGNRVGEAFRQSHMKPIVGWGEWSASSVTHWMPLPPPPEEGE